MRQHGDRAVREVDCECERWWVEVEASWTSIVLGKAATAAAGSITTLLALATHEVTATFSIDDDKK